MRIKEYEAIVKKIDNGDASAVKDALQFLSKTSLSVWVNVSLGDYDQDVDAISCLSDRLLDAVNSGAIVVSSGCKTSQKQESQNGVNNEN